MSRTIAVAGSLAQRPGQGGHAWVFLQYLLGFRRLGWDVLFLDRLEPGMCADEAGRQTDLDGSYNLRYLRRVMGAHAIDFALAFDGGSRWLGMPADEAQRRIRGGVLINVMGFLEEPRLLDAAGTRVFLDIDPGFGQMWQALGLHDMFRGHDAYVTIGERVGHDGCDVPTCGIDWITTRQPIVLEHWPAAFTDGGRFTAIGAWRGPFAPIEYRGKTYGLRVHEFRRFLDLPRRTGETFELALDIHPDETRDLAALAEQGWTLVDPGAVAHDPEDYRAYIQGSGAELMIAKNMYVQSRSGWFSDRSICYLASGKPVVAQDTGLAGLYPLAEGLLAVDGPDAAADAVRRVRSDYARHARAARRVAEEYFDSDKVLPRLLEKVGARGPAAARGALA